MDLLHNIHKIHSKL